MCSTLQMLLVFVWYLQLLLRVTLELQDIESSFQMAQFYHWKFESVLQYHCEGSSRVWWNISILWLWQWILWQLEKSPMFLDFKKSTIVCKFFIHPTFLLPAKHSGVKGLLYCVCMSASKVQYFALPYKWPWLIKLQGMLIFMTYGSRRRHVWMSHLCLNSYQSTPFMSTIA